MSKRVTWALVLLAAVVVVLILNARGDVEVHLVFGTFKWVKSLVFLGFTAAGVVIGLLLK